MTVAVLRIMNYTGRETTKSHLYHTRRRRGKQRLVPRGAPQINGPFHSRDRRPIQRYVWLPSPRDRTAYGFLHGYGGPVYSPLIHFSSLIRVRSSAAWAEIWACLFSRREWWVFTAQIRFWTTTAFSTIDRGASLAVFIVFPEPESLQGEELRGGFRSTMHPLCRAILGDELVTSRYVLFVFVSRRRQVMDINWWLWIIN